MPVLSGWILLTLPGRFPGCCGGAAAWPAALLVVGVKFRVRVVPRNPEAPPGAYQMWLSPTNGSLRTTEGKGGVRRVAAEPEGASAQRWWLGRTSRARGV